MRIAQITPSLKYGDDASTSILNMKKILADTGINSDIYTMTKDVEIDVDSSDLTSLGPRKKKVLYHMYKATEVSKVVENLRSQQKVLYCHNIVSPTQFKDYYIKKRYENFREELMNLTKSIDVVITNSNYQERELAKMGYSKIIVLPPPIDLSQYDQEPNLALLKMYSDDYTNILFVGDYIPNKRLEDVISVFNYYQKRINRRSRLFLVGSYSEHISYYRRLISLINELQVENVLITGRVSFTQLISYYRLSHVFLNMSEHDASCVPIIAAMYLQLPVIAYDSGSAAETLGGAGQLICDKDVRETARLIDSLVSDKDKRKKILNYQNDRAADYHPDKIFASYKEVIEEIFSWEPEFGNVMQLTGRDVVQCKPDKNNPKLLHWSFNNYV